MHRLLLLVVLCVGVASSWTGALAQQAIRVGIPERDNVQYLSLWTALGAGYFKDEGLDVEVVYAAMPNNSGQLLMQNQADIALLQPPVYLGLIAQERPIVLFANLLAGDPINLIVLPATAAARKIDLNAPLKERLDSLKGLKIGVANEPWRRLRVLFESVGMNADTDVTQVTVPGEGHVAALVSGQVDAMYTHTPHLEALLVDHGAVLVVNQSAGEVRELINGQIHSLATTRAYAESNPAAVLAATKAIDRAQRLIRSDPRAAGDAMLKAGVKTSSRQHLDTILAFYGAAIPTSPAVSAAAVERNATLYPARPATPDFTRIKAADYLAPRFAEEVVAARK